MGKDPSGDAKSIAICAAVLWRLGCPDLRPVATSVVRVCVGDSRERERPAARFPPSADTPTNSLTPSPTRPAVRRPALRAA